MRLADIEVIAEIMNVEAIVARARLALRLGQVDYAIRLLQHLLRHVSGHLEARTLAAQAHLETGEHARAARELQILLRLDPESAEAQAGLGVLARRLGNREEALSRLTLAWELDASRDDSRTALARLRGELGLRPEEPQPGPAAVGRLHLLAGRPLESLPHLARALRREPRRLELRLSRAEAWWRVGEHGRALDAAAELLRVDDQCLKAKLLQAHLLLSGPHPLRGAQLLHEAQTQDAAGVIARELGLERAAPPLPELELPGSLPELPPDLTQALAAAEETGPEPRRDPARALEMLERLEGVRPRTGRAASPDPELQAVQAELDRIARRLAGGAEAKGLSGRGGSVPYVRRSATAKVRSGPLRGTELILASRTALISRYGPEGLARIDDRLQTLARALETGSGLHGLVAYFDDPESARRYGLDPVGEPEPEKIRDFIQALRTTAAQTGQELRYVLLIGGDGCLPFCRLPNPVDDYDEELLSDNPYGAGDENILVPELAVGRLPDGENGDPSLLLHLLDLAIRHHRWPLGPPPPNGALRLILRWLDLWGGYRPTERTSGYTAHVWRESSQEVYRVVAGQEKLHVCPPTTDSNFFTRYLDGVRLAYFNLHGTEDSAAWYGQKDHTFPEEIPLFPVAITPETVAAADVSSTLVFSEACYGAHILGKRTRESLALSFLAADCPAFFGSTRIAYGTPRPPLGGADVLGRYLFQALGDGLSVGQALLQAKTLYAQEHISHQGHLDDVDQKTLLGFVLYGDPAIQLHARQAYVKSVPVGLTIGDYCPPLVCRWEAQEVEAPDVPVELVARVRRAIQAVDPSLAGSQMVVTPKTLCQGGHPEALARSHRPTCDCGGPAHGQTCSCGQSGKSAGRAEGYVFSSRETVMAGSARLRRVVRVTTDAHGRIMKMVVSR